MIEGRCGVSRVSAARSIPLSFTPEAPNAESLAAIAEGDAFLGTGEPGRFSDARSLIDAALS